MKASISSSDKSSPPSSFAGYVGIGIISLSEALSFPFDLGASLGLDERLVDNFRFLEGPFDEAQMINLQDDVNVPVVLVLDVSLLI